MSLRVLQSLCRAILPPLACLAVCTSASAQGNAASTGRSIEFSAPTRNTLTNIILFPENNLSLENALRGGDIRFQRTPAVSPRPFHPGPGPRTTGPSESGQDWLLLSPEEAIQNFAVNEMLRGSLSASPRDQSRESSSAIERFYQQLSRPAPTNSNAGPSDLFGRDLMSADDRRNPAAIAGYSDPWSRVFPLGAWEAEAAREASILSEDQSHADLGLAGLIAPRLTPEQIRARDSLENQLREFRKLLNLSTESAGVITSPFDTTAGGASLPAPGATYNNPGLPAIGSSMQIGNGDPGPALPMHPTLPSMPQQPTQYGQSSLAPMLQYNQPRIAPVPQLNSTPPKRPF